MPCRGYPRLSAVSIFTLPCCLQELITASFHTFIYLAACCLSEFLDHTDIELLLCLCCKHTFSYPLSLAFKLLVNIFKDEACQLITNRCACLRLGNGIRLGFGGVLWLLGVFFKIKLFEPQISRSYQLIEIRCLLLIDLCK